MREGRPREASVAEVTRHVTALLRDAGVGDRERLDRLLPLVYEELRRGTRM